MKGRRYPVAAAVRARELRATGWSVDRIRGLIASEFGCRPSIQTVLRWTDPAGQARRDAATRRALRARRLAQGDYSFRPAGADSPERRAAFMRALRAEGVPAPSIAKACRVVFEDDVSERDVRRGLTGAAP